MIELARKEDCVGCNACVQLCPALCISMKEDEQGFLYPVVDTERCIDCHLCEKVCPVINQSEVRAPLRVYAAKNKNQEVKRQSSSGGIFYALAESVIKEKGVVFGAKFNDDWEVVHNYAEKLEDINVFQGSKYVQSRIGDSFAKAEHFLKAGRKVLFTGTPCQIAGLKRFLRRNYDNLIAVDVVCHGVPSPLVWRDYLHYITSHKCTSDKKKTDCGSSIQNIKLHDISHISFRDKRIGWVKFGFSLCTIDQPVSQNSDLQSTENKSGEHELMFETLDQNLFMQGFLKNLYLRPSCYECPAKCGKGGSDITLGDFWGINRTQPTNYDNMGVSLVLSYTTIGVESLLHLDGRSIQYSPSTYAAAISGNPAIEHSVQRKRWTEEFWELYPRRGLKVISFLVRKATPSLAHRVLAGMKRRLRKLLIKKSRL